MDSSGHGVKDPSIEAQQGYWDQRWERQRSPNDWQKERADAIMALVETLPLRNPRILDLGCATGWMTKRLSELGTAEGLDLSEAAITAARSKYPGIRFTAGDLYTVPLTDEPVDLVVCQEVIAHVPDQPGLVERVAEVIKPGGYLVITAANKLVMERVKDSDRLVKVGPSDPDEHLKNWLGMKEFKNLLRPHFKILTTTSVIPMGHRGVLRLVNSPKLNKIAGWSVSPERLQRLKARLGLGYSIIVLCEKPR